MSRDFLRMRTLELELPHLAARLRAAQARIETTQRSLGFTDQAALRERDEVLEALIEFKYLYDNPPPTPRRQGPTLRPVSSRIGLWIGAHGAGLDDAALLAKL